MNETPRGNRLHIGIFGRRNAGKSTLFNALIGQDLALVSAQPGTTTDPVFKSMEILPLGPCVLIDTAGLDDVGALGSKRIEKSREIIQRSDLAILTLNPEQSADEFEKKLLEEFKREGIPVIAVATRADAADINLKSFIEENSRELGLSILAVDSISGTGFRDLTAQIIQKAPEQFEQVSLIGDLLPGGSSCILVCPIDNAAPKGRLILPQVQTLRDLLDYGHHAMVVRDTELSSALELLSSAPDLVITDSQVFARVHEQLPPSVPLTSFSILYARYKGDLPILLEGAKAISRLQDGDRVLIAEACTHHRQEDDIGTVKIPRLLKQLSGADLDIHYSHGYQYPDDLDTYKLIIHCGACMINRRQMLSRIHRAVEAGVPIVNYGLFLAHAQGILPRVIAPLEPLAR